MDIYEYVAQNSPLECEALCNKYGYAVNADSTQDMGVCLQQLVAEQGEPALDDMLDLHPDRDIILDRKTMDMGGSSAASGQPGVGSGDGKCPGCGGCQHKGTGAAADLIQQARQDSGHFFQNNQSGMFILGGLIVITLAIISTKN
jgi:hypothetical protein